MCEFISKFCKKCLKYRISFYNHDEQQVINNQMIQDLYLQIEKQRSNNDFLQKKEINTVSNKGEIECKKISEGVQTNEFVTRENEINSPFQVVD